MVTPAPLVAEPLPPTGDGSEPVRSRNIRRVVIPGVLLAVVVVVGLAVFTFTGGFDSTTRSRVSGPGIRIVRVALVDRTVGFDVTPDIIEVAHGTHVMLEIVNEADDVHDLALGGDLRTAMLEPGEVARLDLGLVSDDLDGRCTLPDHDIAGMTVDIRVV